MDKIKEEREPIKNKKGPERKDQESEEQLNFSTAEQILKMFERKQWSTYNSKSEQIIK